jgi:hypothetical protein
MISPSHLKKHGLTAADYKAKYPGSVLRVQSEETKNKIAAAKAGRQAWNKGVSTGPNRRLSESLSGKPKPHLKGKTRTEEQKQKISEATKKAMAGKMTDLVKNKLSEAIKMKKMNGTYVPPMLGKRLSEDARKRISDSLSGENNWARKRFISKIQELCKQEDLEFLDREQSTKTGTRLNFRCNKCHYVFSFGMGYFSNSQIKLGHAVESGICPSCNPRIKTKSAKELELLEYVRSLVGNDEEIKSGNRSEIFPYELDIYLPARKIAIEFCGIYWHTEGVSAKSNVKARREYEKYLMCLEKGIRLITIFEDEWDFQQNIVKDRLRHILGIKGKIIGARKCKIVQIPFNVKNDFLNAYHIQGTDRAKISLGAFHENKLIAVMTFSPTNFTKGGDGSQIELNRFALATGIHSPGIASKFIRYFQTHLNPNGMDIISYSDNRWSVGGVYRSIGFVEAAKSGPSYFYVDMKSSKKIRKHRSNFMKHRLQKIFGKTLDLTLSEWEIMQQEGYDRIWDCGTTKWVLHANNHK